MLAPEAFAAIPNAWGRQGWTTATLSKLSKAELKDALKIAWAHGAAKKAKRSAELGQPEVADRVDMMLRGAFRKAAEHDARERTRLGGQFGRDGADRDARRAVGGKRIDAGRDRREGDRREIVAAARSSAVR